MNISGVNLSDSLATQATNMQANNMSLKLSATVLKSVMDSQKRQGEALVAMIRQTPSAAGTGSNIDVRA